MSEREKKTEAELIEAITKGPRPGTVWRHYTGSRYRVLRCCIDEGDGSVKVVYRNVAQDVSLCFCRPVEEWYQMLPDGTPRYRYISD